MAGNDAVLDPEYQWKTQPAAAAILHRYLEDFLLRSDFSRRLQRRMLEETGTRLFDWLDHVVIGEESLLRYGQFDSLRNELASVGYSRSELDDGDARNVWRHEHGMFPAIVMAPESADGIAIKVESAADFLFAHGLDDRLPIVGLPLSPLRRSRVAAEGATEVWIVERHGCRLFETQAEQTALAEKVVHHAETFRRRRRCFGPGLAADAKGFDHAAEMISNAIDDLGVARTCDLFFVAEREYWQSRNQAAQIQKSRQDRVGLGWANHDHHTYRSSRENFTRLIGVLELLGFECRERFYGGREAGWGAQVLEQPDGSIVIFADVDLSPEEVTGDFAHEPLSQQKSLGTVGLWCKLHGEAFLQAGMHHLECQFDFDAERRQLAEHGVETMRPFTDFPHLKQAFTVGSNWQVNDERIELAANEGFITEEQATKFRREGAVGSHLEVLQRDDGYKGFNQSGISEIILATDPRR